MFNNFVCASLLSLWLVSYERQLLKFILLSTTEVNMHAAMKLGGMSSVNIFGISDYNLFLRILGHVFSIEIAEKIWNFLKIYRVQI